MKRIIEIITCDRCGKEIAGCPVRIVPHYVTRKSGSEDIELDEGRNEPPLWIERMVDKDFCEECSSEIVEFALNGNVCDECVNGIFSSVNGKADEEDGSGSLEKIPDMEDVDWRAALDRFEQANQTDGNTTKLMEAVPDQPVSREKPEKTAVEGSTKQIGRKKLDHGKIIALHLAGWDNAKIAEEMGTTKNTIAVTISKYKKK